MSTLALIPARGGSKRIPRKNIRTFAGRPIIHYPIEAALQSGCFDRVMISTDDPEIADTAKAAGAEIPFYRSSHAANDAAILADVLTEVLGALEADGHYFEQVCVLLATAPFVTAEHLRTSRKQLIESGADAVIPVVRFSFPIQRAFQMEDGQLAMVSPEYMNSNSQDLPPRYHDAGLFYWLNTASFLEQGKFFMANTLGFELAESEVQDIDTEEDWKIAELKYNMLSSPQSHPVQSKP